MAAVNQLATAVSVSTVAVSLLEVGFYFLYNRIVSDKTCTIHTTTFIFFLYREISEISNVPQNFSSIHGLKLYRMHKMLKLPNKEGLKVKTFNIPIQHHNFFIADDTVTPQETNEAVNVSNSSQEVMKDDQELKQPPDTSADQSVEANLDNP